MIVQGALRKKNKIHKQSCLPLLAARYGSAPAINAFHTSLMVPWNFSSDKLFLKGETLTLMLSYYCVND
jgi:hypothetical protein